MNEYFNETQRLRQLVVVIASPSFYSQLTYYLPLPTTNSDFDLRLKIGLSYDYFRRTNVISLHSFNKQLDRKFALLLCIRLAGLSKPPKWIIIEIFSYLNFQS